MLDELHELSCDLVINPDKTEKLKKKHIFKHMTRLKIKVCKRKETSQKLVYLRRRLLF